MKKCLRYLLMFNVPNYLIGLGFAAVILVGCYATGVPQNGRGLFSGYFNMYPACLLMAAVFSGLAYCTSSLNHALSYGARRSDYFWGMQLVILVNSLIYTAMVAVFLAVPALLGWSDNFAVPIFSPIYILTQITCHAVGCAAGRLYLRSRWIAGLVTGLCTFLLMLHPIYTTIIANNPSVWGDLPWLLPCIGVLVSLLCQFWVYRVVKTATVR